MAPAAAIQVHHRSEAVCDVLGTGKARFRGTEIVRTIVERLDLGDGQTADRHPSARISAPYSRIGSYARGRRGSTASPTASTSTSAANSAATPVAAELLRANCECKQQKRQPYNDSLHNRLLRS
jgi:hypothetical protein